MTPIEIRDALARGMNFDAVMARHAQDIQRDQGIDMGLSMSRARTDVQNIQNQTDEGIDPAPFASPTAPTIGAQSRALDPLMKALTFNPPTAATAPLRTGTPLGSMGIQGQAVPIDYQQDALMDITPPRIGTPNLRDIDIQARAGLPPLAGMQQARLASDALMDMPSPTQQYRLGAAGLESQNILAQLQAEPALLKAFEEFANRPVSEIKAFQSPSTVTEAELMNLKQISDQAYASLPDISRQRADRFRQQQLMDMPSPTIGTPNLTDLSTQARAALMNDPRVLAANALAQPSPALNPNELARFARAAQQPTAGIDPNELARFTRATGQPVSDFSDFEGIASPSFAEQAAQQTAGITADEASLRQATRLAGLDPSEVGRFARAGQPPLSQVQDELDRFEREQARVERTAGTSVDPVELFPTGDPYKNIYSRIGGGLSDFYNQLRTGAGDETEIRIGQARLNFINANQGLATSNPEEYLKKLKEFEDALTDTTSYADKQNELARFKAKAQQTNAAADIAKVTEKEKEVKESKAKADANTIISDAGGVVDFSEFEGLAQPRTGTFYKPENETQLKAAKAAGIIPQDQTLKQAQDSADNLISTTTPPAMSMTPAPAGTQPPVGTPPMGTSVIGGGGFAPAPSAQLTGLGDLSGSIGSRAQFVQEQLTPAQQLARYSSFMPTTALTPEMEYYMQQTALPQMVDAFYAAGGDLAGSPFAPTSGSPFSAFENFMRTGGRLDPTQYQQYVGDVSAALQAADPTQEQQFLSSLYASPAQQLELLTRSMGAGTSAATRGALDRMLNRQYQQQQFQDPATAFLPSALARGGIGGAFSQYVTPQPTVAAAGQPPAMSTIMANQGIIPATSGAIDMDAANAAMTMNTGAMPPAIPTATPPAVPMATTPAIAPTPVVPQSVQSTMPKVNRPQGMSVAFGGQGGGLYDPTTYNMNPNEFASYLDTQREGLTPRYDITGTNIIGYDALGKGQAIRTEIDKQGNQQNMIVNDPNLLSGTTKKKKKKKKKDDETTVTIPPMTMPALVSQGELL